MVFPATDPRACPWRSWPALAQTAWAAAHTLASPHMAAVVVVVAVATIAAAVVAVAAAAMVVAVAAGAGKSPPNCWRDCVYSTKNMEYAL